MSTRPSISARNIEISSKELTSAYRKLERLNLSINTMLDSLGQGLLFFDEEGTCSSVYSKACLKIFGSDPSSRFLPDIVGFSQSQSATFQTWLNIAFTGGSALDFDDLKKLLPQEITNADGAIIELDYKPMYFTADSMMGVLLIASDVTQDRLAEEKIHETEAQAQKILQVAQNRNGFYGFITDLSNMIDTFHLDEHEKIGEDSRQSILRAMHTYKGLAATYSLYSMSETLHKAETALIQTENDNFEDILRSESEKIKALIAEEKAFARDLFGPDFMTSGRVKTVEIEKIEALTTLIYTLVPDESRQKTALDYINREIMSVPVFEAFLPFEREVKRLAEQQGKLVPHVQISGTNLVILPGPYEAFFNVLIHLARNIADHGLEDSSARAVAGKDPAGHVKIGIQGIKGGSGAGYEKISIEISDDGKGIDPDMIRQKLTEERGLDVGEISDNDILDYIFSSDFSLRKNVTMLSGRGTGMNALRHEVEILGGQITVSSNFHDGGGTCFKIELPYVI